MFKILISSLLGFALGIIPFSYLIARIRGLDLKKTGSGNIGATNLGRALGLKFFLLGFFLDALKGLVPVLLCQYYNLIPAVSGAGAILGHIFNPLFKFKGGKGVSTTIGVTLGIVPRQFLISILFWLIVYFATYIVSLASIGFAIILSITTIILNKLPITEKILILIIGILVIFAHRSNIKIILNKTEPKTIFWRRK